MITKVETPKNKIIPKTEEGIKCILKLLNYARMHNKAFYEGTFRYFTQIHPPYPESLIYYNIFENNFKFIFRQKLAIYKVLKWNQYTTNDNCILRERSFGILSMTPFCIIVSNANFLLDKDKLDNEALIDYFHTYMINNCDEEIKIWKSLLNDNANNTNELF